MLQGKQLVPSSSSSSSSKPAIAKLTVCVNDELLRRLSYSG